MMEVNIQKRLWSVSGGLELDICFQLELGQCLAIYGESGAGKTSLLRIISGLLSPDQGHIQHQNHIWVNTHQQINLSPQVRPLGFLFQDYALFPNMTVRQNLDFARAKGQSRAAIAELIEIMDISDLLDRKPLTLSGGQKQRVALARSLVPKPQVLLLDEPLSALDTNMRRKLQDYLLKIQQTLKLTTLIVSHDIAEIYKLADQVIVLRHGSVEQQGTPAQVFQNHELSGKFQFIGEIVEIKSQDFLQIISVLIGKDIIRVIADEQEASQLQIGDQVIVASKAFNPVIRKLQPHD